MGSVNVREGLHEVKYGFTYNEVSAFSVYCVRNTMQPRRRCEYGTDANICPDAPCILDTSVTTVDY